MATNRCTYYNGQREGNFSTCKNPCMDDVEIYCFLLKFTISTKIKLKQATEKKIKIKINCPCVWNADAFRTAISRHFFYLCSMALIETRFFSVNHFGTPEINQDLKNLQDETTKTLRKEKNMQDFAKKNPWIKSVNILCLAKYINLTLSSRSKINRENLTWILKAFIKPFEASQRKVKTS